MRCRIWICCAFGLVLTGTAFGQALKPTEIYLGLNGIACIVSNKAQHVFKNGSIKWQLWPGVGSFTATFSQYSPFSASQAPSYSYNQADHEYHVAYPCRTPTGVGCAFTYTVKIVTTTGQTVTCDPDIIIDPMLGSSPAASTPKTKGETDAKLASK